jgi:predicted Zn-dependent protease
MIPLIFMTGGLGYIAYQAAQIGVPLTFLKFSRNVESEADKLGAQYLWASGYDPNNFLSFFEKLEKKEKHKPGTLSKLFGTHPPTPDRILKVHDLLARFPDRDEYTVSTSEFNKVKARLLAKPTLKRRDSDGKPADTKPPETKPPDQL